MDRRPHRLATPLVAAVALIVVGAAVAASLADGRGDGARPGPATSTAPAPTLADAGIGGVLRLPPPAPGRFAGSLIWTAVDCSARTLDLATGTPAPGLPRTACDLWPSADGRAMAYSVDARAGATRLEVLLRETGDTVPGPVRGGATAVAGDGTVATCGASEVLEKRFDGAARTLPGCGPAFGAGGLVRITVDARRAVDDRGRTVVPAGVGTIRLLAAAGDAIAVVRSSTAAGGVIEVWRRGRLDGGADLAGHGQPNDLRISPDGTVALVRLTGPQDWALVRTDRVGSLSAIGREGVREGAFSPDGRYVAVVTETAIVILDATRLAPLAAFQADAKQVAWLA